MQGVDSDPGYIYNKTDSLTLGFDSGYEFSFSDSCNFSKKVEEIKKKITLKYHNDLYKIPELNHVYIDTIDNKVATIIIPNIAGKGLVKVSISDCKTGAWLGISGYNLSLKNQKRVLEIFQTITHKNNAP